MVRYHWLEQLAYSIQIHLYGNEHFSSISNECQDKCLAEESWYLRLFDFLYYETGITISPLVHRPYNAANS